MKSPDSSMPTIYPDVNMMLVAVTWGETVNVYALLLLLTLMSVLSLVYQYSGEVMICVVSTHPSLLSLNLHNYPLSIPYHERH